jgi:hypothetical protein
MICSFSASANEQAYFYSILYYRQPGGGDDAEKWNEEAMRLLYILAYLATTRWMQNNADQGGFVNVA